MEGDTILLQDIFLYQQHGRTPEGKVIGEHITTGYRPKCVRQMESMGYVLPKRLFQPVQQEEGNAA
jgi:pilus assembly protein CpaF